MVEKMKAYVQTVKREDPIYLGMIQADLWFEQRGYEVVRFEFREIAEGNLDDDLLNRADEIVVRGGVEAIRQILLRAGRPLPPNLDLPESLSSFICRKYWQTTMGDVRKLVDENDFQPLHVKPLAHHKLFSGHVVRRFRDLILTAQIPAETPLLAQEYVEFKSEWRTAILRDTILKVGHYRGDPLLFPDIDRMQSAMEEFTGRPIGFAMDWGITTSGETLLIEVNDGFSLGNYGLSGLQYTALIEARWRELMGLPDNGVGISPE